MTLNRTSLLSVVPPETSVCDGVSRVHRTPFEHPKPRWGPPSVIKNKTIHHQSRSNVSTFKSETLHVKVPRLGYTTPMKWWSRGVHRRRSRSSSGHKEETTVWERWDSRGPLVTKKESGIPNRKKSYRILNLGTSPIKNPDRRKWIVLRRFEVNIMTSKLPQKGK